MAAMVNGITPQVYPTALSPLVPAVYARALRSLRTVNRVSL